MDTLPLTLPPHEAGERLEDYLRRCIRAPEVNTTTLARAMGLNRTGLYRIRDGAGQASPSTLARFGALSGVLQNTESVREFLALLRLLEAAEVGWAAQSGTHDSGVDAENGVSNTI